MCCYLFPRLFFIGLLLAIGVVPAVASAAEFTGTVVDTDSGEPIPARVYVETQEGEWLYVKSASSDGSALPYLEQWVPMPGSVERHTTISAHPFRIDLAPGRYTITIERGKEYVPLTKTIVQGDGPNAETFRLKRWVNMAERGWYSGETHVHRRVRELANVQRAEDLNVTFPVTFWTVNAFEAPGLDPSPLRRQGPSPFGPRVDHGAGKIDLDATHVIFPRNTEYEIFSVGQQRRVLGAVFILNHRSIFQIGMPPVAEIAAQAHREGALLDLDKHSWPWSMMLVPIAKVDLYELSNNSVWRTRFGFKNVGNIVADYMQLDTQAQGLQAQGLQAQGLQAQGLTEWGWLQFGFENYYALLNCGFRLQPTAGTASGVHPVPLGYSRVYVYLPDGFQGEAWIDGLRDGHSFVTTGPMLMATVNGTPPGTVFSQAPTDAGVYRITGEIHSDRPLDRVEILVNGRVKTTFAMTSCPPREQPPFVTPIDRKVTIDKTSWIAVRCVQAMPDGRSRFAHTAPWHVEVGNQRIQPRPEQIQYLIRRVADEIERNREVLPDEALAEFEQALQIYKKIAREVP